MATYLLKAVFQLVSVPLCPTHCELPNPTLQFELSKNFAAHPTQRGGVGGSFSHSQVTRDCHLSSPLPPLCCCKSWFCRGQRIQLCGPMVSCSESPWTCTVPLCAQCSSPTPTANQRAESWVSSATLPRQTLAPYAWSWTNQSWQPITTRYVNFRDFIPPSTCSNPQLPWFITQNSFY